ncbi:BT_3928 family protein [Phaeocystidibacter marisrubri]|uniref:DoxX family protein n=1 Tax=Phaeocystidibacter marisrubri TaxID=1577780 RepID=A0A6L3ZKY7_9FLAO|nr:BT_3928 family protein [Phaeocystidibacter marisrubri]KAB2818135.1 DoxX family protein [Phaeocystidibacter marisrubri]GGH71769.1 hypothetical protein GCM10011318_15070 [Phaeocystidibacter marisrubri]
MRRYLVQFIRILVGALFIFSGYVKLNDPMGFGFKLEEYFSESVLNLPFFTPYVVEMAIAICVVEIVVGLTLLLGIWRKLTLWVLTVMIVFFTFLTFYSSYYDVVTDCGCFGDAIPLTPDQSFGKDVILTILILILVFNRDVIQPIVRKGTGGAIVAIATLLCFYNSHHVLNHLPRQDFRAYKIGTDIAEGMKSAEELGKEAPVYETFFIFENEAGERVEVSGTAYVEDKWYEKTEWTMLSDLSESRKIKDGYEPPIHDFIMESDTGDITTWVLEQPKVILVLSYLLEKADSDGLKAISAWSWPLEEAGYKVLGWTNSGYEAVEEARHEHSLPFSFVSGDGTTIKTVVRSNPGIVALKNGVIVGKWHWNDRPTTAELEEVFK